MDFNTVESNVSQAVVGGISAFQALVGSDFSYSQGTVRFAEGEVRKTIEILLTPDSASSNPLPKLFYVVLRTATGGASLNKKAAKVGGVRVAGWGRHAQ